MGLVGPRTHELAKQHVQQREILVSREALRLGVGVTHERGGMGRIHRVHCFARFRLDVLSSRQANWLVLRLRRNYQRRVSHGCVVEGRTTEMAMGR